MKRFASKMSRYKPNRAPKVICKGRETKQLQRWAENMLAQSEEELRPSEAIETYAGDNPRLKYLSEEWRELKDRDSERFLEVRAWYLREWDKAQR